MFRFPLPLSLTLWLAAVAQTSASGLDEWTDRSLGLPTDLHAVAFGEGKFVAVGQQGIIFVSSNGATWQPADSPATTTLRSVAYGAGSFVAVGDNGTIITSTNGFNWVPRQSGSTGELFGVVHGGGRFVAVGRLDSGSGYRGVIVTSTDGVSWFTRDPGISNPLFAVTYGDGIYVAVGFFDEAVSINGLEWSRESPNSYNFLRGLAYGNGRFVSGGEDTYTPGYQLNVSPDARAWQSKTMGIEGSVWAITHGGGVFAAVGDLQLGFGNSTNVLGSSANGESWTIHLIGPVAPLRGIAYGRGAFVAVGLGGTIVQSGVVTQPTLAIQRQAGEAAVMITVSGDPGIYRLQTTTNLAASEWSDWMTITNPVASVTFLDNTTSNLQQRYYRLVEP